MVESGAVIDEIRRIYRELDRLLDAAGRGAVKRTLAAAGVGGGYLRDVRRRLAAGSKSGYDLGILLRIRDALGIERAALAGYDWGGRAACLTAILSPSASGLW